MNFLGNLSDHAKAVIFYAGAALILALKIFGLFAAGIWLAIPLALAGIITDAQPTG